MPFYDLRCMDCEEEFNISASMKEKSEKLIECPLCNSRELVTVFKAPPAVVKGGKDATPCPNASGCGYTCRHAG